MKTPKLAKLSLQADVFHAPSAEVESLLAETLSKLPSLTSLHLPPWWITPTIANTAASCPKLRELLSSFGPMDIAEWMTPDESGGFKSMMSTSLPTDSFPSLNNLTIPMSFARARDVVSQEGDYFHKLTRFHVTSPWFESPDVYRPLHITTEDVVTIARALPSITTLSLNPTPTTDEPSTLSVGVLSPLLAHCPNLDLLMLYMNTSEENIPPPPSDEESWRRVARFDLYSKTLQVYEDVPQEWALAPTDYNMRA
ncbi:hypothetical protein EYR36_008988 [Pleurotus pulmonarius]|nr:hypothetical protein EYR36_008988 [Pleurotus pulmonarius]